VRSSLPFFCRCSKRWEIFILQRLVRDRCVGSFTVFWLNLGPSSPKDLGKAANFPYATINPEEARIPVPDPRFEWLCELYKPVSRVPAFLTCIDIAGLTAGASTGAGLGNAFLSHVRAVDGIFQVVRAFDDTEVIHVEGDVDPLRDMEIIQKELRLKDIEWVEKHLDGLKRTGRSLGNTSLADKAKKEEIAIVEEILRLLTKESKDIRKGEWSNKEVGPCFNAR
jgi:obg-like ATPase 1